MRLEMELIDKERESTTITLAMTVCIAAVADKGKKAVLIADKMLTAQGLFPYQSDGNAEKILKINDDTHVMWCGGLNDSANVLTKAKEKIGEQKLTVLQTAEEIRKAYLDYLLRDIFEKEVIQGRGIPNLEAFYGDATIKLTDVTRQEIEKLIPAYNLLSNTSFIICGKDEDGLYKIYTVGPNPRFNPVLASEGWTQIGSGAFHAQYSIIHSAYNLGLPQEKVKKILLDAKRKAEKEPSVGKKEDTILLD